MKVKTSPGGNVPDQIGGCETTNVFKILLRGDQCWYDVENLIVYEDDTVSWHDPAAPHDPAIVCDASDILAIKAIF